MVSSTGSKAEADGHLNLPEQTRSTSDTVRGTDDEGKRVLSTPHAHTAEGSFTAASLPGEDRVAGVAKTAFRIPEELSSQAEITHLMSYLNSSPTAWHATVSAVEILVAAGFTELKESDPWCIQPDHKYVVTRNGSSFIAFVTPKKNPESVCILGAHTDSPGLKLKPNPDKTVDNIHMLMPEVYGGPVLPSWFDRRLGLAGRITVMDSDDQKQSTLIRTTETIGTVSHVAIHLEGTLGNEHKINRQDHLGVICTTKDFSLGSLLQKLTPFSRLIGHELFLVPREEPEIVDDSLILSARLDNLLGTHASLFALLNSSDGEEDRLKMIACWDNEEIGSDTAQGAGSTFLPQTIKRIAEAYGMSYDSQAAMIAQSGLISIDVAHARHPNYFSKHEPSHAPQMGEGPVIKVHANQSYATGSETAAWIIDASSKGDEIPVQKFCIRSDTRCGSTIGNIVATQMGIRTVDIGAPILAMHSIMEKGHTHDHLYMTELLKRLLTLNFE